MTLEEARAKDPESGAVKLGLESLEDDRARLVDGYLEVADRYLAKQELESAVPYFLRRVLAPRAGQFARQRSDSYVRQFGKDKT